VYITGSPIYRERRSESARPQVQRARIDAALRLYDLQKCALQDNFPGAAGQKEREREGGRERAGSVNNF